MAHKTECSGFGLVKKTGNNFLIYDVVIPKQQNSSAYTVLDTDSLCEIANELISTGKDTADWHCWWHSHASFNVFYSGTDKATIGGFMSFYSPETSYLISIVVNHRKELICRLDIKHPIEMTIGDAPCYIKKSEVLLLPASFDKEKIMTLTKDNHGFYAIIDGKVYKKTTNEHVDVTLKKEKGNG